MSWIFKLEFVVRVEIDEGCPATNCESFSAIAAGNCTSELVAFPPDLASVNSTGP